MRLVQASLAAVGAFWSELIPAPSLWDYEGAALADREAEIDAWEPDGLLGREPSHADYDDSIFRSGGQTFQTGARPNLSTSHGGKCKCGHWLHFGNLCAACGCASCTLPAAAPADEPPGGIEPKGQRCNHHCYLDDTLRRGPR